MIFVLNFFYSKNALKFWKKITGKCLVGTHYSNMALKICIFEFTLIRFCSIIDYY